MNEQTPPEKRRYKNDKRHGGLFPRSIGQCVDRVTKPMLKKQGAAESRLLTHWAEIVGPVLSKYTLPQKINFPRDATTGATLVLLVHSGWALEVQHQEPLILERIATFFGYRVVSKLSIRQGYIDPAQAPAGQPAATPPHELDAATQKMLEEVSDPTLREALASLAHYIPSQPQSPLPPKKS